MSIKAMKPRLMCVCCERVVPREKLPEYFRFDEVGEPIQPCETCIAVLHLETPAEIRLVEIASRWIHRVDMLTLLKQEHLQHKYQRSAEINEQGRTD